ncbi:TPA: hypothetical protein SJ425_003604 [Yersinia enterocolitica]|uniref:Lipoprotein n=1 Tax=Yersinia kristensenii TaxID=28152 RepID=A0A0T9KLR9_YERKR|nr:hypothetical protein [Yersinia kristensenii]CNE11254.1 Uncharacterised protein [Yersinia kristensenii]HEI6835760.1 hypothetical protein [Yersinia enterocolitica]
MNKKLLAIILCMLPLVAKSDPSLMNLMCVTEFDFHNKKTTQNLMMIDVKSSNEGMGYAVTKFLSRDGGVKLGMTYFKASGKEGDDFILFSTRQNLEDIGKDADFLGIGLKNQGDDDHPIYGAVIGRGHDSVTVHQTKYFCMPQ